jgi:hypothetical protein
LGLLEGVRAAPLKSKVLSPGRLDLAVANFNANNVSVLLGNGDGTFQPAQTFGADSLPFSVAVGDFNDDGMPDLAVANFGSTNVSVLINNTARDDDDDDRDDDDDDDHDDDDDGRSRRSRR